MKIVRFENGKFGIRRWFFGYEFLSQASRYWFSIKEPEHLHLFEYPDYESAQRRIAERKSGRVKQIDIGQIVTPPLTLKQLRKIT